jgi:glycosyltransferase involved in cell wall biosynthesis
MHPLKSKPSISFCLAAYNEESNVSTAVSEALAVGRDGSYDFEILVCDDASTDRTATILERLARVHPEVRLLRHEENRGIIATFETLYRHASKDYCFINGTDNQVPMRALDLLVPVLQDCDIVVGQRHDKNYGLGRQFVSGLFNFLPLLLFRTRTFDAGTVKLWPRLLVQSQRWVSQSPFREAERLIRAARAGYRILPVVVPNHRRSAGKARGARLSVLSVAALDVFRVWIDLLVRR